MTLPLYAYRCTQCGHRFEKIQNFSAEPELECPECHGALERPLTAPGLRFKGVRGRGFYKWVAPYLSRSDPFCASDHSSACFSASALDRKSTRLNSSHLGISYAVFCLKK